MPKIELSEQDLQNLLAFLNRVQLQGAEASALVKLQILFANALRNSNVVDSPVEKKEEKKEKIK